MQRACFLASVVALSGCSAIINPDPGQLGGDFDAGFQVVDSGPPPTHDSGPIGPPPVHDAGPPPTTDAGGPTCAPGQHCEGDTLVSCAGGVETRTDCQSMSAFCASNQCQGWVCMPGQQHCTGDFRGVVVCSDRGDMQTTMPCDPGCNPTTNACVMSPAACAALPRINLGDTRNFDLCHQSDNNTFTRTDVCSATSRANLGDQTFRLTLTERTTVQIELRDNDPTVAIDTIVYVRRVCDDSTTQIACDDDIPCDMATIPPGPTGCRSYEVRQSILQTTLDAGTYYIVADAFMYSTMTTSYNCGQVQLTVTTP